MSAPPAVNVLSVGARTPLGLSALQVAMSLRARLFEPRSTVHKDRRGFLIGASRSPGLSDELFGFDRFVELGAPALRECAGRIAAPVPLILALPDADRPDQKKRAFDLDLVDAIAARAGVRLDRERSAIVRADNAGFGPAIAAALERVPASGAVLVGGVDSYFHPDVLAWLDEEGRLHSHASEDGIVPGEGAAFALLAREGTEPRRAGSGPRERLAVLRGAKVGREQEGEAANMASTLTALVRELLPPKGQKCWLLTDCNGERGRRLAWGKVLVRIGDDVDELIHDRFVLEMGDSGAATGALLLAIACTFFRTGCAPATDALFGLAADGPARAAFAVRAAREGS